MLPTAHSYDVVLDVTNYNAAISVCEKGEQWQQAQGLLATTQNLMSSLNVITYNSAIVPVRKGRNGSMHCFFFVNGSEK